MTRSPNLLPNRLNDHLHQISISICGKVCIKLPFFALVENGELLFEEGFQMFQILIVI